MRTAADRSLPCRIHPVARLDNVAHDHSANFVARKPGALQRLLYHDCAEFSGGRALQRTVIAAESGQGSLMEVSTPFPLRGGSDHRSDCERFCRDRGAHLLVLGFRNFPFQQALKLQEECQHTSNAISEHPELTLEAPPLHMVPGM